MRWKMMLEVCHYDLTMWIFWLILAILFVCVLILCCQLRNPRGTTENPNQPTSKSKSKKEACVGEQYFGYLSTWQYALPENCKNCGFVGDCLRKGKLNLKKDKTKTEYCKENQFLGFLYGWEKHTALPLNCGTCPHATECMKKKPRLKNK